MNCQTLGTNINVCDNTQLSRHYKEKAYIMPFDKLINPVATGNIINFLGGEWYTVTDVRTQPFNGTTIKTTVGEHGAVTSSETVVFPLLDSNPQAAEIIQMLKTGRVVMILEQIDYTSEFNRWLVLGGQNGLKASEESFSNSTDGAWLVTLTSERNNKNAVWFSGDMSLLMDYEYITGLTIGDGTIGVEKIYLKIEAGKTCYIILPNGEILTSYDSEIYKIYQGPAGRIKMIIPKDCLDLRTYHLTTPDILSTFEGEFISDIPYAELRMSGDISKLKVDNAMLVTASGRSLLTDFSANKAISVDCSNSALSAKSIGDWLIAMAENHEGESGSGNFSGGTNANEGAVESYLGSIGYDLQSIIDAELSNFSLTFN